ncbi:permease-like cell division protein FtsX, partial [Patescibacteria group bacterium]|nr:permease-like cell division protein FtsX [Patescibacteria group bacterium]
GREKMKSLKTSWKHIRRNPYQSMAAIFITTITFFAISIFAFIIIGSSVIVSYLESRLEVVAFFKDEAKQVDINVLQDKLKHTGKIARIKFVSKKDALAKYREQNKNDPVLLELVTEDILPSSLEISTTQITDLPSIAESLKNSPLVSLVRYPQDVVSTLTKWINAIKIIGVGLVAILTVESVFIIISIVGFKISQKKEEIEIMRLLSATNWYIRWPFILEGIFYGIIGTILGWISAAVGLWYATPYLQPFLKDIPLLPVSPIFLLELLLGELLIAVIIGVFASMVAVLRYLK